MASIIGSAVKKMYAEDLRLLQEPKRKWLRFKNYFKKIKKYYEQNPFIRKSVRAVLLIALIVGTWAVIMSYNRFAQLETRAEALYADLGKELKRRTNLIPNLNSVVREYTLHEADAFKYVSDAREKLAMAKDLPNKLAAAQELEQSLSSLFALFEQYPDLKATQSAQDLIKELAVTENRIAEAKANYNENTRLYNQLTTMFPGNILWFLYRFPPELPYVGIDEEDLNLPTVKRLRGAGGSSGGE